MLKKLAWIGVIVLVGVVAIKATGHWATVKSYMKDAKSAVTAQIPLERQIKIIEEQLAGLKPDVEGAKTRLAERQVAAARLQEEVAALRVKYADQRSNLKARADQVGEPNVTFIIWDERRVSVPEAKRRLAAELRSCQLTEAQMKEREQRLAATEEELRLAQEQLEALIVARDQATAQVEQLKTELATLRIAETRSRYQADDSRLAEVKRMIEQARERIEVAKKKHQLDEKYGGSTATVPTSKDVGPDALEAARSYLGEKAPAVAGGKK